MKRDGVDLAGDEAGKPPRRALGNELGVVGGEPGEAQHFAADQPVEAADAARGREPPALEVGRRLDLGAHHIGLGRARGETPDLPRLEALGDRGVGQRRDRRALSDRGDRGAGEAAVELDDVGVDAALGKKAERLCHIGRGVHHVRRGDRNPDIDPAQRSAAVLRERRRGKRNQDGGGECGLRAEPEHRRSPCSAMVRASPFSKNAGRNSVKPPEDRIRCRPRPCQACRLPV